MPRRARQSGGLADLAPLLGLGKGCGELRDDAVAERVGHVQDVLVDRVIRGHVSVPVAGEPCNGLGERGVEVSRHSRLHVGERPIVRVALARKRRDVVAVAVPLGLRHCEGVGVAALGGREKGAGDDDVLTKQGRELMPAASP